MSGKGVRWFAAVLAVALLASAAGFAAAAGPEKPELVLSQEVRKEAIVKDADGKEKVEWREAGNVSPGDVLKYTITYRNAGTAEARLPQIVSPVPKNTAYVAGSAEGKGAAVTYSLDGKIFREPTQLKHKVRQPDGTEVERYVDPEMYTHVQWKLLSVPPGGTGTVSFRVTVR